MPRVLESTTETNTAAITTSATGAGSFTSQKLRDIFRASVQVAGYVAVVTSVSGDTVDFQLYQQSAATGALTEPASAVTIAIGDATFNLEGN